MLDTIVLRLDSNFQLLNKHPERFNPVFQRRTYDQLTRHEKDQKRFKRPYTAKFIYQSTAKTEYFPRVEIYEHPNHETKEMIYNYKLELSVPKLHFGNNLLELSENDADKVAGKLREQLRKMGLITSVSAIQNSLVSKFHLGKNVILPPSIKILQILNIMNKVETRKGRELSRVKYTNKDESLHLYAGIRDEVLYEKISDIKKTKVCSKDKLKSDVEALFVELTGLKQREVFRYEVRFKNAQNVQSIVNTRLKRPYDTAVTFNDIFNRSLWKTLVNKHWQHNLGHDGTQLAMKLEGKNFDDIFTALSLSIREAPNQPHSINKAMQCFGLAVLVNVYGVQLTRKLIETNWSDKAWQRFQDKMSDAKTLLHEYDLPDEISYITNKIETFERMTTSNIKKTLQNKA